MTPNTRGAESLACSSIRLRHVVESRRTLGHTLSVSPFGALKSWARRDGEGCFAALLIRRACFPSCDNALLSNLNIYC
jgi:hypothetical protein